jgi:hypothetical protein
MKKMAIFVEGQTEQMFAEGLIRRVAGERNIHIDTVKAHGGKLNPRQFLEISTKSESDASKKYYVIIYDSNNDGRVLSDIIEKYDELVANGYSEILGIRDVYPQVVENIPAIRASFASRAPSAPIPSTLILSVMEIEAWFIAEYHHFQEMHPSLTHDSVTASLGYDPATYDSQRIPQPAVDLKKVYCLAQLGYNKSKRHVERTVEKLNYAHIYFNLRQSIPDLETLVATIDRFMT